MRKIRSIYKLYLRLLKRYGRPEGFWEKWCKRKKTKKDKEEIVLGAILTQRTNWKNVELALRNLRKAGILSIEKIYQAGNPEGMSSTSYGVKKNLKLIESLIRPSGFYKQKAKRLFQLCEFIIEDCGTLENFFSKDLRSCRKQLLKIYGIGPETADSILLYAGDLPIFVIDEYTRRFVKKYHIENKFSYDYLQQLFQQNLPKEIKIYQDFHALIVLDSKPHHPI